MSSRLKRSRDCNIVSGTLFVDQFPCGPLSCTKVTKTKNAHARVRPLQCDFNEFLMQSRRGLEDDTWFVCVCVCFFQKRHLRIIKVNR